MNGIAPKRGDGVCESSVSPPPRSTALNEFQSPKRGDGVCEPSARALDEARFFDKFQSPKRNAVHLGISPRFFDLFPEPRPPRFLG